VKRAGACGAGASAVGSTVAEGEGPGGGAAGAASAAATATGALPMGLVPERGLAGSVAPWDAPHAKEVSAASTANERNVGVMRVLT